MGSSATPPWMSELAARNHKILRNIIWHSSDSYFNGDEADGEDVHPAEGNESVPTSKTGGNHKKQVVEPKSTSIRMNVTQHHTTSGRTTMAAVVQEQMHKTKAANKRKTSTEKSSPIREDGGGFMDDVNNSKSRQYLRNGEEESILEYGPGIVRKLRSRYQSLALRQYSTRPSLRRSTSLENIIDLDTSAGEGIISNHRDSSSPTPFSQNYTNKKTSSSDNKGRDDKDGGDDYQHHTEGGTSTAEMTKSKSATVVLENRSNSQMYEKKPPGPRGRAAVSERRDRMRRARSVDTLQRTKHEEEILEKFKAVVLPKEEIVIIEVSRPRANLNGLGGLSNNAYYLPTAAGDKAYPTQLYISPDRTAAGLTSESEHRRSRSFVSPEHELPQIPSNIVRETARIFEKNTTNKRVGHALRLTHSSINSSNPSSPTPPPQKVPTSTSITTTTMAQGVQSISENKIPVSSGYNITNAKPPLLKQIGIIKPTLSHSINGDQGSLYRTSESKSNNNILSPILSPTQQPYKLFLQQHSSKPPLSPKPLFTSSPKPPQSPQVVESPTSPIITSHPSPASYSMMRQQSSSNSHPVPTKNVEISSFSPINRVSNDESASSSRDSVGDKVLLVSSKEKEKELPSSFRQPLKHIPNSFTIDANAKEIVPASVPLAKSKKSSPNNLSSMNGTKFRSTSPTTVTPPEPKNVKAALPSKLNEPSPVCNLNVKSHERQKSPSPQPHHHHQQQKANNNIPPVAPPPVPQRKVVEESNSNNASQLRVHQKQKSNQGGNSPMVFNFTTRSSVPDYIEDDGLHKGRLTLSGTVTDESADDIDSTTDFQFDAKLIFVVGGNVIINGKSSIQKRPKSTKMNISFNEEAITTYEYPSELSLLVDDDSNEKDMLGHKGPSVINNSGSGLSSYTSKLANNDYQLGNFDAPSPKKTEIKKSETELIEDYLKPDSEDTTWSNEITADILF